LAYQLLKPEVLRGQKLLQVHVLLDELNEWQEQRAVEPVLVKLVRRHVRRGHHHHRLGKELFEKPAQDHGIGNVGDMQLVETDETRLLGQSSGNARERITGRALPGNADALVHLCHELVEVHAPLGLEANRLEEEVHQHGLAAANGAKDVVPLGRRRGTSDETTQTARSGSPTAQGTRQRIKAGGRRGLRRVRFDHTLGD
jgi:hypothetical protein